MFGFVPVIGAPEEFQHSFPDSDTCEHRVDMHERHPGTEAPEGHRAERGDAKGDGREFRCQETAEEGGIGRV